MRQTTLLLTGVICSIAVIVGIVLLLGQQGIWRGKEHDARLLRRRHRLLRTRRSEADRVAR